MEHNDFWDDEDERCECEDCQFIRWQAKKREEGRIWAANQRANQIMANLMGGFEDEV